MTAAIEPRVEVHDALRLDIPSALTAVGELQAVALRAFTIEQCWSRGRFEASLFAPTEERSYVWRSGFIRDQLPLLPADRRGRPLDPASFWLEVARYNGEPQAALQKRLGRDAPTLERVLQIAEQQDILYRLPHWTAPGEISKRSDLVYWTDSGLLHRLLNARSPDRLSDRERGKSFEGFAIASLAAAGGPGAKASVWRRGEDEIDLILEWDSSAERWAIEITHSKIKKLGKGFWRGCEETEPTRIIAIQREPGATSDRRGVERMELRDALREVLKR